jgi:hypothetical protein
MSDKPDPHTTVHPPAGSHHVHEAAPMHDAPDEWHDHSHDEQPQHAHGEVQNSRLVLGVGIALFVVIVVSVMVVFGFYTHYNTRRSDSREHHLAGAVPGPVELNRAAKDKDLTHIKTGETFEMDTETEGVKKTVTLAPIDKAMDKVAHTYAQQFSSSPK